MWAIGNSPPRKARKERKSEATEASSDSERMLSRSKEGGRDDNRSVGRVAKELFKRRDYWHKLEFTIIPSVDLCVSLAPSFRSDCLTDCLSSSLSLCRVFGAVAVSAFLSLSLPLSLVLISLGKREDEKRGGFRCWSAVFLSFFLSSFLPTKLPTVLLSCRRVGGRTGRPL